MFPNEYNFWDSVLWCLAANSPVLSHNMLSKKALLWIWRGWFRAVSTSRWKSWNKLGECAWRSTATEPWPHPEYCESVFGLTATGANTLSASATNCSGAWCSSSWHLNSCIRWCNCYVPGGTLVDFPLPCWHPSGISTYAAYQEMLQGQFLWPQLHLMLSGAKIYQEHVL